MADQSTRAEVSLVAELNDLLQLDHDAVQAYTMAIENLEAEQLRSTLLEFRSDHERHITDLTRLIRAHGGIPLELAHVPTGFFKLAVQKVGTAGGDREILLAFKANERQVREKYRRAAAATGHPEDVLAVLRANASDEERHYDWVSGRLEAMGVGAGTMVGRAEGAFERVHEAAANVVEGAERRVMEAAEGARRSAKEVPERMRERAGSGLQGAAGAVDRAGRWIEGQDGAPAQRVGSAAYGLADTLESAAHYLRTQDLHTMRADLERQVDLKPIRSVLLAAGAGFVIGKLLR